MKKKYDSPFDLEHAYSFYPRKGSGKGIGMKKLCKIIKTQEDFDQLVYGIRAYCNEMLEEKREKKHIKLFSTFVNEQVWLDYDFEPNPAPIAEVSWNL